VANRYLTKSRFKTAVECPTKLAFVANHAYANTKNEDEFLKALADGGFQIGELAKLCYPNNSHEVTVSGHAAQILETENLLKNTNIVIFEGAIRWGNLFARVDIIKKTGSHIELIEVKAKTYDPELKELNFENKDGSISASSQGMLPYLQDVAFQKFILEKLNIEKGWGFTIDSFLMLCDKSVACTVDGLNQKFKLKRTGANQNTSVVLEPGTNVNTIGQSILTQVNVNKYVNHILNNPIVAPGVEGYFEAVVTDWAKHYVDDVRIPPQIGGHCAKCEFRCNDANSALKSGFHECWEKYDMTQPNVLDLYKLKADDKSELIRHKKIYLSDLIEGDLTIKSEDKGLTQSQRRQMQVEGEWTREQPFYLDHSLMSEQMSSWQYPYSFIDFETCAVAVPFFKGKKPYAPVAFQFSIHTMDEQGVVKHAGEFLEADSGKNPTYNFVRELKKQLSTRGTVFMWSPYENTTLNRIYRDIVEDLANQMAPSDAQELIAFIDSLTTRKDSSGKKIIHRGDRAMVDLCALAEKSFFHPDTKGRSSIKVVLPAVMKDSVWLKNRYSSETYGANEEINGIGSVDGIEYIESRNFKSHAWWQLGESGQVKNPYELLAPMFDDVATNSLDALEDDDDFEVKEGGAASTAFARLQFEQLSEKSRANMKQSLLRYCELDTLAMVMILEAWRAWLVPTKH